MNIVLIGFMGAGKTSVAKELATRMDRDCIDLDDVILECSDCESISEIFNSRGEAAFRSLEAEALRYVLAYDSFILATGGGIIEQPENIAAIRSANAKRVYLRTSYEEIVHRIASCSTRPLFKNREKAEELYRKRLSRYEDLADFSIETDGRTIGDVASEVLTFCRGE